MKLHFWGATDDVTGSMTFVDLPEGKILVDCGLTQGTPEVEKINDLPLPFPPESIKSVIITHAHLDHSGYLPRLIKKGFRGPIHCTPATAKLMRIILLDSAALNDEDFYGTKDVQQALNLIQFHEWHDQFTLLGATVEFLPAGHILGASSVKLLSQNKSLIFSGDLGRNDDPILPPLNPCPSADAIVMESTYGSKIRTANMEEELHAFLKKIAKESRVGIIASFAVARAQNLMTLIYEFHQSHPEFKVRVVMDSPMMKEANKVYQKYAKLTNKSESLFTALNEIDAIEYQKEWQSLQKKSGPLVIISSSGMLTGGRIARHLDNWASDEKAILFLPGYQGEGTPGRSFLEGNRTMKDSEGKVITWSGEVLTSEAFSSHADQSDLLNWVTTNNSSSSIYLLHGELKAKEALKAKLEEQTQSKITIASRGSSYLI